MERLAEDLAQVCHRLGRVHPRRCLNEWLQRLDDLHVSLLRCARQEVRNRRVTWKDTIGRLTRVRPANAVARRREVWLQVFRHLHERAGVCLESGRTRFMTNAGRLRLLGPEQVLGRGYSITMDAATGHILRDASRVKARQRLRTRLKKGEVLSQAESQV